MLNIQRLQEIARGEDLVLLTTAIERAVRSSFTYAALANGAITQNELKDRIRFCVDMASALRIEHRWSVERVSDEIPNALRAHLLGLDWKPSERSAWFGR